MDIEKIKLLAEIFDKYGLTALKYSESADDSKLILKKADGNGDNAGGDNTKQSVVKDLFYDGGDTKFEKHIENDKNFGIGNGSTYSFNEDVKEIKSPLVGVFYAAASPDDNPYVAIGSKVKKGDTLCIIESMKLMNEISADWDCEIIDVCVNNGELVEYGQILFKVI
jgi:acetyl-CoA carboxylase biotin carboxyl carrier protein